jgi:hypothetical protein
VTLATTEPLQLNPADQWLQLSDGEYSVTAPLMWGRASALQITLMWGRASALQITLMWGRASALQIRAP